jgi:PAS domain S-box-containing protein
MEERGKRPSRPKAATQRPAPVPAAARTTEPSPSAAEVAAMHPLAAAAATLRLPIVLTEGHAADARVLLANARFEQLSGFPAAEVVGRSLRSMLARKGDTALDECLAAAEDPAPPHPHECCFRHKDGTNFWAALAVTPLPVEQGGPVRHLIALHDMTAHRKETNRLRLLLAELNHRTQNMFSAVLELIRHSLRGKAAAALVDTLTGRILAFSRAQTLLREEADDRITLRQVLALVLQPPTVPKELATRVELEGEDVPLATNAALTTAMALHELAVNAVRHGALSGDAGVVRIHWTVRSPPRGGELALRWQESGGPRMKPLYDKGFGMRLIEGGVQHGLGGTARMSLEATGLVCDITLPLRQDGRNS